MLPSGIQSLWIIANSEFWYLGAMSVLITSQLLKFCPPNHGMKLLHLAKGSCTLESHWQRQQQQAVESFMHGCRKRLLLTPGRASMFSPMAVCLTSWSAILSTSCNALIVHFTEHSLPFALALQWTRSQCKTLHPKAQVISFDCILWHLLIVAACTAGILPEMLQFFPIWVIWESGVSLKLKSTPKLSAAPFTGRWAAFRWRLRLEMRILCWIM